MSVRKNISYLYPIVSIPVILIILGSFALSGAAVMENLRFINATNQVLELVSLVRQMSGAQKNSTFFQNPGEDIWADLEGMGQIVSPDRRVNPWKGDIRAVTVAPGAMWIESPMPTHDCRRLALYFMERSLTELGLVAIKARSPDAQNWGQIYPPGAEARGRETEMTCGTDPLARLALVFKLR